MRIGYEFWALIVLANVWFASDAPVGGVVGFVWIGVAIVAAVALSGDK